MMRRLCFIVSKVLILLLKNHGEITFDLKKKVSKVVEFSYTLASASP